MKTIYLLIIAIAVLLAEQSMACVNDYGCEYGGRCVQTTSGYGVCVGPNKPDVTFDASIYQNQPNYAAEIQNAQLRQLEIQRRQLELKKMSWGQ